MICVAVFALLLATEHSVTGHDSPAHNDDGDHKCGATYAAYVPKYIRPGVDFTIDVEILCGGPYALDAELKSSDYTARAFAFAAQGKTAILHLRKLQYGYIGSKMFNVTVIGRDNKLKEIFRNTTTDIQYQTKFLSIFIETDKTIYKPGHTIKFRAAVTTASLLPFDGRVSYKLQDPIGNIILREENVKLNHGVVGSHFKLDRYSTQGQWKITYEVHGYEKSLTVPVEEYTLPKFSAEIKTDQAFLYRGSEALTGIILARYTFGQPVRGKARVEFTHNNYLPRNRIRPKIVIHFPEFDGTAQFKLDAKEIAQKLQWNPEQWSVGLSIVTHVSDKTSGESAEESKKIPLHTEKMKVTTLAKPEHIKPGLQYVAYLQIVQQDGSVLSVDDLASLVVDIEARYSYKRIPGLPYEVQKKDRIVQIPVKVGDDGLIIFKTIADEDDFINVNFRVMIPSYKKNHWMSWNAKRFESPSNTYLQLSTDDTFLSVGEEANLKVVVTRKYERIPTVIKSDSFRIMIMAKGRVVESIIYTPTEYNNTDTYLLFDYSFIVTVHHSPSVYVVVSFVREDGEFIADSVKINVQAVLEHVVTMSTSDRTTDAGQPVSITVQADAGSYVGLRAVDQSVLLLRSGNDITQEKIFQDLDEYGPSRLRIGFWPRWGSWWRPWGISGGDVSQVFENSGIIVLSDGVVYKREEVYLNRGVLCASCRRIILWTQSRASFDATDSSAARTEQAEVASLRSYFPESWIWTDSISSDDGSVTFNYSTPDTITTWEISSFAMSDIKGLGVPKDTSKITVFRNFFISINLPSSTVRGETLAMKTTLFNYFDMEITATLTLTNNEWYDLVIPSGAPDPNAAGPIRTVVIPSKDSRTVVFPIIFKKAGNARIAVHATSPFAGDAIERTLLVKPGGIPKIVSHSNIIDHHSKIEQKSELIFDVDIPDDAVEGSVYVKFTLSGNILGSALNNLGNLLRMPGGCGEQNMVRFAPDVYISLYLKNVGELIGAIKQKSQNHIRQGYNNELRYQRQDGSFSAFGERSSHGSTWLTAFVVKCFVAANKLNPVLIEERKIDQAIKFILQQQNEDGTFKEPGKVFNKNLQGGVNSKETTTAYMVIAMTEEKDRKDEKRDRTNKVDAAVKKAQIYLEERVEKIKDIYTLSIVAYALTLVASDKAATVLRIIDDQAVIEDGVKYWKRKEEGAAKCNERKQYCPFDADKPNTSSIEITAYVLLNYVKMERHSEVMPIVRWLVEQRGAFGGYHSTQDTVMAIQALSKVAWHFSEQTTNLDIKVKHSAKADFNADFKLSDYNAIILQMADLPSLTGTVTICAEGVGVADVQVTVGYNLPVGPRSDEPFVLEINSTKTSQYQTTLRICSKINEHREVVVDGTGMYVVSFTLPSGYTVDDKKSTKENRQTSLIELVGDELTGYFDELPRGEEKCMNVKLDRYAKVAGVKPQILVGYDYYRPAFKARRMIVIESEEDVCDICGKSCVGCPQKCPDGTEPPCCGEPDTEPCKVCSDGEQPPCCGPETFPCPPETEDSKHKASPCCGPSTFPCPDFSNGLYFDSKSHIMKMIKKYGTSPTCTAPNGAGDSSLYTGLPASLLDGTTQYIECSKVSHFKRMLKSKEGFTISLLLSPVNFGSYSARSTMFSIGSEDARMPYIALEENQRIWDYELKVLLNGYQVIVDDLHQIRFGDWCLLTIKVNGTDVKVFSNGRLIGRKRASKRNTEEIAGNVIMKIGKSHTERNSSRGNFNGLASSLNIWNRALTDEQIVKHYTCYSKVIFAQNPKLDLLKVHHVVPKAIRRCFLEPYTASDLKSRAGELTTACD